SKRGDERNRHGRPVGDCVAVPGHELIRKTNAEEESAEKNKRSRRPVPPIDESARDQGYQQKNHCGNGRTLPEASASSLAFMPPYRLRFVRVHIDSFGSLTL